MQTLKRIPTWFAISEMVLVGWFGLAVVSILIYSPFWIVGHFSKKRRRPAERAMRVWPLIAVLSLLASYFLFGGDPMELGNLTGWSFGLFLATLVYAIATIASAIAVVHAPKQNVRKSVRRYSGMVTTALLIGLAYLAYWGVIGIRTWS